MLTAEMLKELAEKAENFGEYYVKKYMWKNCYFEKIDLETEGIITLHFCQPAPCGCCGDDYHYEELTYKEFLHFAYNKEEYIKEREEREKNQKEESEALKAAEAKRNKAERKAASEAYDKEEYERLQKKFG